MTYVRRSVVVSTNKAEDQTSNVATSFCRFYRHTDKLAVGTTLPGRRRPASVRSGVPSDLTASCRPSRARRTYSSRGTGRPRTFPAPSHSDREADRQVLPSLARLQAAARRVGRGLAVGANSRSAVASSRETRGRRRTASWTSRRHHPRFVERSHDAEAFPPLVPPLAGRLPQQRYASTPAATYQAGTRGVLQTLRSIGAAVPFAQMEKRAWAPVF